MATPAAVQFGSSVTLNVTLGGSRIDEILNSISYQSNGLALISPTRSVNTTISTLPAGRNVIRATVTDVFGNTSWAETVVMVYQPLVIGIAQPVRDSSFSPDANVPVSVTIVSGQYSNISWLVDGTPVPGSNFISGSLGKLSSGRHGILVNVTDLLGRVVSSATTITVQSDFQLSLLAPAAGLESIIGNEVSCMAGVDKFAGSDFNVSDAAQNISWYMNGSNTGSKGLTYKFIGNSAGSQRIQARYEKGDMVRTTVERTVLVRDIAMPVITQPSNGATIVYSQGSAIPLLATGEPGATFSWSIDGLSIAVGREAAYNPNGLSGQKQLKLVTSAFGRTREALATINLSVNNPPTLSLVAPPVQYTGDTLAWTASAFDVEDQNPAQSVEIFLDGVRLENGARRVLRPEDVGQHTLSARTADTAGVSISRQVNVRVESSSLLLEIQSPQAGATFYSGYDVRLAASLAAGSVDSTGAGTYNWTVQYLDDPSAQSEIFAGSTSVFRPKALGELSVAVKYLDGNAKERGSSKVSVRVEREALRLGIYWPHGSVVNSGEQLLPRVTGLPETGATGTLTWSLNGTVIPSITSLRAPALSGNYTLTVQYAQNGSVDSAEIAFMVNTPPVVTITNPVPGGQYVVGNPLVLSARIDDDQAFTGAVVWKDQDGLVLGEANPLVLRNATAGEWRISATAADRYGAATTSVVPVRFYTPVSVQTATVNGGLAAYLVAEGSSPLGGRVEYSGGIAAWTLRQGDRSLAKSGREVSFTPGELASFQEGPAILGLAVIDNAMAEEAARNAYKKDFPLVLARNALAALAAPAAGDLLWVGSPIPLRVSLTGFAAPSFSMTMNGIPLTAAWESLDGTRLYETEVPASAIQTEGVYELSIAVSENGTNRIVPATLNVYTQRSGIFVDNAPAVVDLESGAPKVTASVSGLQGVDEIQWRTDTAATPVGTGTSLNLAAINLVPGNRSITVEALSSGRIIASASFLLKVLGPMKLAVMPSDEPLIVQRGAAVNMNALAKDRDGSVLSGSSITWSSHLDGALGTGETLALAGLISLSEGEHIFTVMAIGANGESLTVLKRVKVNVTTDNRGTGDNTNDNFNQPDSSLRQGLLNGFGPGAPLGGGSRSGPLGPGGQPIDTSILFRFNMLGGGFTN